jgi:hypothetical protein
VAERIYSLRNGPISVQIEANRRYMAAFSRKTQNAIIRASLDTAGKFWAEVFLPKRFTNYAKTVLGFNPSRAWENAKRRLVFSSGADKQAKDPQPTPLVYRGVMRRTALGGWRAASVATAKKQVLTVRIPLGHAVKPHIAKLITRVPKLELQRIVEVFAKTMPQQIGSAYGPQLATARSSGIAPARRAA